MNLKAKIYRWGKNQLSEKFRKYSKIDIPELLCNVYVNEIEYWLLKFENSNFVALALFHQFYILQYSILSKEP